MLSHPPALPAARGQRSLTRRIPVRVVLQPRSVPIGSPRGCPSKVTFFQAGVLYMGFEFAPCRGFTKVDL